MIDSAKLSESFGHQFGRLSSDTSYSDLCRNILDEIGKVAQVEPITLADGIYVLCSGIAFTLRGQCPQTDRAKQIEAVTLALHYLCGVLDKMPPAELPAEQKGKLN